MKRINPAWIEGIIIGVALGALWVIMMLSLSKGCGIETGVIEAIGSEG